MTTTTLVSPLDAVRAPAPGLAAALRRHSRRAGLALWRGLEAYGRAKALRELGTLHDRWESSDPKLATRLRAATAFLVAEGKRAD